MFLVSRYVPVVRRRAQESCGARLRYVRLDDVRADVRLDTPVVVAGWWCGNNSVEVPACVTYTLMCTLSSI